MTPFLQTEIMKARALLAAHDALDDDDIARLDAIEGETDLLEALDWLIKKDREANEDAKACAALVKEYRAKQDRKEAWKEHIRIMIEAVLEASGQRKIKRPHGTASINEGRVRTVVDVDALTQGYFKTVREKDADAIKSALDAGEVIPGVSTERGPQFVTVR